MKLFDGKHFRRVCMTAIISSTAPILSTALPELAGPSASLPQLSRGLLGDERMWLFNRLPRETLKEKHGFTPEPGWAEHLQRAAVRLSSGGSGSFVSSH